MKKDKIQEMLSQEYSVTLSGSTLGYLLMILSEKQHELNKKARDNIMDVMAHMTAGANDVVGNVLLHEVYRVAGAEFLAFTLDTDAEAMDELMKAETDEELKEVDKKMNALSRRPPKGKKLH